MDGHTDRLLKSKHSPPLSNEAWFWSSFLLTDDVGWTAVLSIRGWRHWNDCSPRQIAHPCPVWFQVIKIRLPANTQIGKLGLNLNNVSGDHVLALKWEKVDRVDYGVYFCAGWLVKNYMQIAQIQILWKTENQIYSWLMCIKLPASEVC